jgi:hypothetical protein
MFFAQLPVSSGKWDEQVLRTGETVTHEKPTQHLIAEVRRSGVEMTIGIDLEDVWAITAPSTKTET